MRAEPYDYMPDHPNHPRYNDVFARVFGAPGDPVEEEEPSDSEMSLDSTDHAEDDPVEEETPSPEWEAFTNTRGGEEGQAFNFDWIPDLETESE